MITTILSPTRKSVARRRSAAFTLVEFMVAAGLGAFILAGTLSAFLFLGRSGANIQNYSDMESQARKALEVFAADVRQASAITWTSNVRIALTVDSLNVAYVYTSDTGTLARVDAAGSRTLITGIRPGSFSLRPYNVSGTAIELTPMSTATELSAAGTNTKQLQISLETSRTNQTVVTATNAVLSARFVLRNKIVTA